MQTLNRWMVVIVTSLLLAACGETPTGVITLEAPTTIASTPLEFRALSGIFRLQAPTGWRVTEPVGGLSHLITTDKDIAMAEFMTDPMDSTLATYRNPRLMTAANGKQVTVYDAAILPEDLDMTSSVDGMTFDTRDSLIVQVPIGDKSYLVAVSKALTTTLDTAELQEVVDMLGTLEYVGGY